MKRNKLTISAGGMQTKRAIIEMYAYTFVLSIPVCEVKRYIQVNATNNEGKKNITGLIRFS